MDKETIIMRRKEYHLRPVLIGPMNLRAVQLFPVGRVYA